MAFLVFDKILGNSSTSKRVYFVVDVIYDVVGKSRNGREELTSALSIRKFTLETVELSYEVLKFVDKR